MGQLAVFVHGYNIVKRETYPSIIDNGTFFLRSIPLSIDFERYVYHRALEWLYDFKIAKNF